MPKRLTVRLDDQAHRGWTRCALEAGCTLSSLMEAIGRNLDEKRQQPPGDVVRLAREIDVERRRRGGWT